MLDINLQPKPKTITIAFRIPKVDHDFLEKVAAVKKMPLAQVNQTIFLVAFYRAQKEMQKLLK